MKKLLGIAIFLICLTIGISAFAMKPDQESEYIFVVKNDTSVAFDYEKPFTINGYTYVPDYFLRNHFGVILGWNDQIKTLYLEKGEQMIQVDSIHQKVTLSNGEVLNIPLHWNGDVLMVPVEPILQDFGYSVSYLPEGKILRLLDGQQTLTDQEVYDRYIEQIDQEREALIPKKIVYLTFDDGPNRAHTPMILDLLKKYDAKATFFMLEPNMKNNPDLVRRVYQEGHAIGLHGVTHDYKKVYRDEWSVTREMVAQNETLDSILGYRSSLVRVPYGSSPMMTAAQYRNLTNSGYLLWDWNIDSGDSLKQNVPADTIYQNAIATIQNFKTPVILFHDHTNSVYALERVLVYLRDNGYTALPITDKVMPYNWKNR